MGSDKENERSRKEEGDRKGKGKAKDQDQDGDDQPQHQQQMKEIRRPPPLPAVKGTMGAIGASIPIQYPPLSPRRWYGAKGARC